MCNVYIQSELIQNAVFKKNRWSVFDTWYIFFVEESWHSPPKKKKERKKGERLIKLLAQSMGKYIISDNTQFVDSINWKKAYNVTAKVLSLTHLYIYCW